MEIRNKLCARKATWLAFGLIALAAISSAQNSESSPSISTPSPSFVSHFSSLISENLIFLIHSLNSLQTTDVTSSSSVPTVSEYAITSKPLPVSSKLLSLVSTYSYLGQEKPLSQQELEQVAEGIVRRLFT